MTGPARPRGDVEPDDLRARDQPGRRLRRSSWPTWRCAASPSSEAARLITTYDIRWACDVLRPVYDESGGRGRPGLARGRPADRPATRARPSPRPGRCGGRWTGPTCSSRSRPPRQGCPPSPQCLAEGISVNVTLIFSLERYGEVIDAFMAGLERRCRGRARPGRLASVASFFVSRVDTEVDGRLDKIGTPEAAALRGKAALANARLAYELYEQRFATPALAGAAAPRGARRAAAAVGLDQHQGPGLRRTPCTWSSWSRRTR